MSQNESDDPVRGLMPNLIKKSVTGSTLQEEKKPKREHYHNNNPIQISDGIL